MSANGEPTTNDVTSSQRPTAISRRTFVEGAALAGAGVASLAMPTRALGGSAQESSIETTPTQGPTAITRSDGENPMYDELTKEKIRRALLAGPDCITREATVAEMGAQGEMTVLRPGKNQWVCVP